MVGYNRVSVSPRNKSESIDRQDFGGSGILLSGDRSCGNNNDKKVLDRKESYCSSRSASLSLGNNSDSDSDSDNDEDEVLTKLSGERSPLNDISYISNGHDEDYDEVETQRPDLLAMPTSTLVSVSYKQIDQISAMYSGSFDLDDDDDDDDDDCIEMKRYNFDFPSTTDRNTLESSASVSNWFVVAARYLWLSFQSVRQQARQRRAQLLLQQTERNWQQSIKICLMTNCDATDTGILLVIMIMVIWIFSLSVIIKDPIARMHALWMGILLFGVRVGTRPLCEYILRLKEKRLRYGQQQQQHDDGRDFPRYSTGSKARQSDFTMNDQCDQMFREKNFELRGLPQRSIGSGNKIYEENDDDGDDINAITSFQFGIENDEIMN